jgi:iron complex outermembrane recepter protein
MARKFLSAALSAAMISCFSALLGLDRALAQTTAAEQSSGGASDLGEVVVVARRVEESLEKVPLTITAISQEQLQLQTVTTGTDLQGLVPSLSVGISIFGATQQYSLRGIRDGVVEYFNEVPIDSILADSQLWDLTSVQAVAGPQGTLFGRNSTGGDVLFVPQKPTKDFEGFAQVRYGSYNLTDAIAVVNIPISDTLQVRFGGEFTNRDGITKNLAGNDLGQLAHQNLRFSLLYTPLSWLSDYAVVALAYRHDTPVAQVSGIAGSEASVNASLPGVTYGYYEYLNPALYNYDPKFYYDSLVAQQNRGVRTVDVPLQSAADNTLYNFTNILTADLQPVTLRYISGYQGSWNHQLISDLSIPLPVIIGQNDNTTGMLTQEGQALGAAFDHRLDWVAGIYYSNTWNSVKNSYLLFQQPGTPFNNLTTQQSGGPVNNTFSVAEYGQATLALTDALKFTGGVRYTRDRLDTVQFGYYPGQICNLPSPPADAATCRQAISTNSNAVTYNVSLEYQLNTDLLLYGTTRKGYNAGGFNPGFPPPVPDTVKPEYIRDYEVGLKEDGHLGSMPIRVNVSAYLSHYDNIQRTVGVIYPIDGHDTVVTAFLNAATATLYGSQIEVLARPFPDLTLQASYGYLHTKYDSFETFLGSATGNKFAQAPDSTAHFSATYRHSFDAGQLVANASYSYISSVAFQDINLGEPGNIGGGYGLLDLRLGLENIGNQHIDLSVYGKNVANKIYELNASDDTAQFGFVSKQYGDPRTFGVEVRYSFGK